MKHAPYLFGLVALMSFTHSSTYAQERHKASSGIYYDQLYFGEHVGDWNSMLQIFSDNREALELVAIGTKTQGKRDARLSLSITKANECVINDFPFFSPNPDDFLTHKKTPVPNQKGMFQMNYTVSVGDVRVDWVVDGQVFSYIQEQAFSQAMETFDLKRPKNADPAPLLRALETGRQLVVNAQGLNAPATFSLNGYQQIKKNAVALCLDGRLPKDYAR